MHSESQAAGGEFRNFATFGDIPNSVELSKMESFGLDFFNFLIHEGISRNILSGAPEELRKANSEGQTPLLIACKQARLEVAKWLFDNGAAEDVRTADYKRCTPMLIACRNGHLEVAQWLFGAGAAEDVRTPDKDGSTPMYWACHNDHLEVAQWLLLRGATNCSVSGHIDRSILVTCFSEIESSHDRELLHIALSKLLTDHFNFITYFLAAVSKVPEALVLNPAIGSERNVLPRTSPGPCPLPRLRGLESSVVSHIADFTGIVRGRCLRNLREACSCLGTYVADVCSD